MGLQGSSNDKILTQNQQPGKDLSRGLVKKIGADTDRGEAGLSLLGPNAQKSAGLPKTNLAMVGGSIIDDKNSMPSKNALMKKKTNPDISQGAAGADNSKCFLLSTNFNFVS